MFKLYNKTDAAVQVKTDVDTYSIMPRAVADVEGSKLLECPESVQVLASPEAK